MKRIIVFILLFFFIYLGLFTWNLKTGVINKIIGHTGLEIVGWILSPGDWLYVNGKRVWENYIHLVDLKKQNIKLENEVKELKLKILYLEKEKREALRLRKFLKFSPPKQWHIQGARVISHKIGPNGILKTIIIDKGLKDKVRKNTPVVTYNGVVGRVIKLSYDFSIVLLLTDLNSRIPVISIHTRTKGILKGTGDSLLKVIYIDQSAPLSKNEIFVTSGLANIFPKGLPVAKITDIKIPKRSLFKEVTAIPVVDVKKLEEILLLSKN